MMILRKIKCVRFWFSGRLFESRRKKAQATQQEAYQLDTFRFLCQNDYGIKDNTPAMSACMQDMDKEASRRARDAHQSMIKNTNDNSTSQVNTVSY